MKNNSKCNKGFIVPLIIGIVAVLAIGAAIYAYESKKAEAPVVANSQTNSPSVTPGTVAGNDYNSVVVDPIQQSAGTLTFMK